MRRGMWLDGASVASDAFKAPTPSPGNKINDVTEPPLSFLRLEKPRNSRLVMTPELPRAPRSMAEAAVFAASPTVQLSSMACSSRTAAPTVMPMLVPVCRPSGDGEHVQLVHAGALVVDVVCAGNNGVAQDLTRNHCFLLLISSRYPPGGLCPIRQPRHRPIRPRGRLSGRWPAPPRPLHAVRMEQQVGDVQPVAERQCAA